MKSRSTFSSVNAHTLSADHLAEDGGGGDVCGDGNRCGCSWRAELAEGVGRESGSMNAVAMRSGMAGRSMDPVAQQESCWRLWEQNGGDEQGLEEPGLSGVRACMVLLRHWRRDIHF